MGPGLRRDDGWSYFFAAAARSTKVLPPFILWASGASLIWITTASASTPRFFTSAWVMSRIMPAFCSSVRPAAMLTVISGISHSLCFLVHLPDPAHPSFERWTVGSTPLHVMPRQHFALFWQN